MMIALSQIDYTLQLHKKARFSSCELLKLTRRVNMKDLIDESIAPGLLGQDKLAQQPVFARGDGPAPVFGVDTPKNSKAHIIEEVGFSNRGNNGTKNRQRQNGPAYLLPDWSIPTGNQVVGLHD